MAVCVHDVQEADDGWVVHFFEEGDLADGCGGDTLIFGFETDLLQGDDAAGVGEVARFVDDSICSCWENMVSPTGVPCVSLEVRRSCTFTNLLDLVIVLHDGAVPLRLEAAIGVLL